MSDAWAREDLVSVGAMIVALILALYLLSRGGQGMDE